jgi:hypothetical protein
MGVIMGMGMGVNMGITRKMEIEMLVGMSMEMELECRDFSLERVYCLRTMHCPMFVEFAILMLLIRRKEMRMDTETGFNGFWMTRGHWYMW